MISRINALLNQLCEYRYTYSTVWYTLQFWGHGLVRLSQYVLIYSEKYNVSKESYLTSLNVHNSNHPNTVEALLIQFKSLCR